MKRFIAGAILGIGLTAGFMYGQPDRPYPRIFKAIEALRDARAYLEGAPIDFGGHKAAAIRATDDAIRQLQFANEYRERR
jgi:hypothetical protein